MTSPGSGFPDWQQYASWRGENFVSTQYNLAANQLQDVLVTSMGNYGAIRIYAQSNANGAELLVFGGDTQFTPDLFLVNRWVIRPNTTLLVTTPVISKYIRVQLQGEAGLASTIILSISPINVQLDKPHYHAYNSVLTAENRVLGAFSGEDWFPNRLLPGPAHLWLFSINAGVDMQINVWTLNSDGSLLERVGQWKNAPGQGLHDNFVVPGKMWKVTAFNNTGVNQTYFFTVTTLGAQT